MSYQDLMDDQAIELDRQKEFCQAEIEEEFTQCKQFEIGGEMGLGLLFCTSCKRRSELQVCRSGGGFYVGIVDNDGPFCRATDYASKATMDEELMIAKTMFLK